MNIINSLVDIALCLMFVLPFIFKFRIYLQSYQKSRSFKEYFTRIIKYFFILDEIIILGAISCYSALKMGYEYSFIWFILIVLLIFYAILCLRSYKEKLITSLKQSTFTRMQVATTISIFFFITGIILLVCNTQMVVYFVMMLAIIGKYLISLKLYTFDKLLYKLLLIIYKKKLTEKTLNTIFVKSNNHEEFLNVCSWQVGSSKTCKLTSGYHTNFVDYLEELIAVKNFCFSISYEHPQLKKIGLEYLIKNYVFFNEKNVEISYNINKYLLGRDFSFNTKLINQNSYHTTITISNFNNINYTSDVFYPPNQQVLAIALTVLSIIGFNYKLLINNNCFANGNLYCEDDIYYSQITNKNELSQITNSLKTTRPIILYLETNSDSYSFLKDVRNTLMQIPSPIKTVVYAGSHHYLIREQLAKTNKIETLYLFNSVDKAKICLQQLKIDKPYYVLKLVFKE